MPTADANPTPAMKITAISPWFGSKRMLAGDIVSELGPHKMYYETFCGSLAVLLEKPPAKYETVCDLHDDLTNLARVIAQAGSAELLYDRLQRTLFAEGLLIEARTRMVARLERGLGADGAPVDAIDWAYWFFLHSWAGRNGTAGSASMSFKICVRWTPNGGSATTRFRSAVESIPAWHERLRNVVILTRDAFDVHPSIPDEQGIALYCDPPYLHSTRSGNGDGGYRHDFAEAAAAPGSGGIFGQQAPQDHHARLAAQLARFKLTRVVVSYYDHPRLKQLYPPAAGWRHVAKTMTKNLHVQNRRGIGKREAPEVLIVNGPSLSEGGAA